MFVRVETLEMQEFSSLKEDCGMQENSSRSRLLTAGAAWTRVDMLAQTASMVAEWKWIFMALLCSERLRTCKFYDAKVFLCVRNEGPKVKKSMLQIAAFI